MICGKTLPHTMVSNGRDVTTSDSEGSYQLPFWGTHVYCVAPSDYSPFQAAVIPLSTADRRYDIFPQPCNHPTGEFVFAQMTDCHITQPGVKGTDSMNVSPLLFEKTLRRIKTEVNPDFLMLTGDQVDIGTVNELELMFDALDRVGLPAVQVNGNHEAQCRLPRDQIPSVDPSNLARDEVVDNFYTRFGPTRFAFFWGRYLFLVLDCMSVRDPEHHQWLWEVLQRVPTETPLVVAVHHPEMVFLFPELFQRNLKLAVTGHYHTHQTFRQDGVLHSSPGPALAAGVDGFPPAYRVYYMPDPQNPAPPSAQVHIRIETANTVSDPALRKLLIKRVDWPHVAHEHDALETCWSVPLDGAIKSSTAVLADDRIVVAPYDLDADPVGRLQVFDLATGQPLWTRRIGDGFFGTPVVRDDLIFAQSITGQIYCFQLENGYIRWQRDLGLRAGRCCTGRVVIEDNLVLVGDCTYFAALERTSGIELWAWPEIRAGGAFYTAGTAVGNGVVLVGNAYDDRGVIALQVETGKFLWSSGDRRHTRRSHCVFDEYFYFSGPYDLICLDPATGQAIWMTPCDPWSYSEPLVCGEKVFIAGSQGNLQAFDRQTGRPLWRTKLGQPILPLLYNATEPAGQLAAPVACGEHLLLASNDGNLYALEAETGRIAWRHDFGIPLTSTPVVHDTYLLITTPDATLWKFKLPPV